MAVCTAQLPTESVGEYRPRQPQKTALYQVVSAHWPNLRSTWEDFWEDRYGPLRHVVAKTFEAYLDCGLLERGFARLRCAGCGHELLLAFSCKTRGICPSCGKKRQLLFSEFVAEKVIQPVPHRQVVLTLPKRLRPFFATRRKRLSRLARAGYLTIRKALRQVCSSREGQPGAITAIQTFGSLLDFHPHLHVLVTWGIFDKDGTFHEAAECPRAEDLQDDFRERVFRLLLKDDAIDLNTVESMKTWPHSGFGANISAQIVVYRKPDGSCQAPGNLLEYFVRPSVSLKRLEVTHDGKVLLQDTKFHPKHGGNFRIFDPAEFLVILSLHIPDPNDRLVSYAGVYSNRLRSAAQAGQPPTPLPPPLGPAPPRPSNKKDPQRASTWARLIAFVWEVDPLLCPACGGEMKIVAVITSASVVSRILDHIHRKKPSGPDPPLAPTPWQQPPRDLSRVPFLDDLPWGEE